MFRLTGNIDSLWANIALMQKVNWIDNRTRAIITEFAVYNAQVTEITQFLFAWRDGQIPHCPCV
jgi:Polycystin cation channel